MTSQIWTITSAQRFWWGMTFLKNLISGKIMKKLDIDESPTTISWALAWLWGDIWTWPVTFDVFWSSDLELQGQAKAKRVNNRICIEKIPKPVYAFGNVSLCLELTPVTHQKYPFIFRALGCLIYELCSQKRLFRGKTEAEIASNILNRKCAQQLPEYYPEDLNTTWQRWVNPHFSTFFCIDE